MKTFLEYQSKIQHLAYLKDQEEIPLSDLLAFIDLHFTCSNGISFYQKFFKAEYAFYSSNYAKALHIYLSSKLIPNFSFFCYRTAAYLAKEKQYYAQALVYAKKAQFLNDKDYSNNKILHFLRLQEEKTIPSIFSLAKEEREALTDLFSLPHG